VRLDIPRDVSLDGHVVDGVIGYLTLSTGIAFAVLVLILAVTLLFHRADAERPHAYYTHGDRLRDRLLTFAVGLTLFVAIDVTLAVRASAHLRERFWNYPDADPNALRVEVSGSRGAVAFDLEDMNALQYYDRTAPADRQGFTKILVTEPVHPYIDAWWPAGHMLGYEHGFVHQAKDFVEAIAAGVQPTPSFADGLQVQRVLGAVEQSSEASGVWTPTT